MKSHKHIWSKPGKGQETIAQLKSSELIRGAFIKKTKKIGKSKPCWLALDENFLYIVKNEKSDKVHGVLELTCTKLDLLHNYAEPKSIDANADVLHGFRFMRNGKISEFYTKDDALWKQWKAALVLRAI